MCRQAPHVLSPSTREFKKRHTLTGTGRLIDCSEMIGVILLGAPLKQYSLARLTGISLIILLLLAFLLLCVPLTVVAAKNMSEPTTIFI